MSSTRTTRPPVALVSGSLGRRERLRRVVILCCNFTRNLAFYRAGWAQDGLLLVQETHPQVSFWRQTNSNFIDICVLEWCKLLGDKKAEHYWARIVSDPTAFEAGLYGRLGMDAAAFQAKVAEIRTYRDKFVAHLDSSRFARIPMLDGAAEHALAFYHDYVVTNEALPGDLTNLPDAPDKLSRGYVQSVDEATAIFRLSR